MPPPPSRGGARNMPTTQWFIVLVTMVGAKTSLFPPGAGVHGRGEAGAGAHGAGNAVESGPLRAVHLSRHKWPGELVNQGSGRLSESTQSSSMVHGDICCPLSGDGDRAHVHRFLARWPLLRLRHTPLSVRVVHLGRSTCHAISGRGD